MTQATRTKPTASEKRRHEGPSILRRALAPHLYTKCIEKLEVLRQERACEDQWPRPRPGPKPPKPN